MIRLKLSLHNLTREQAYQRMLAVWTGLSSPDVNPVFANPTPPLAGFKTKLDAIAAELAEITALEELLKSKRMNVDEVLLPAAAAEHNLLGGFVVNKAGNRPELVPPTGFILAEQPGPPTPMVQVTNLVATTGDNDGEIDLAWDVQRAADGYEIQFALDTPTGFAPKDFTGYSKSTQSGLPSLKKVWFRVRAIRGDDKGPWSDPACGTTT